MSGNSAELSTGFVFTGLARMKRKFRQHQRVTVLKQYWIWKQWNKNRKGCVPSPQTCGRINLSGFNTHQNLADIALYPFHIDSLREIGHDGTERWLDIYSHFCSGLLVVLPLCHAHSLRIHLIPQQGCQLSLMILSLRGLWTYLVSMRYPTVPHGGRNKRPKHEDVLKLNLNANH